MQQTHSRKASLNIITSNMSEYFHMKDFDPLAFSAANREFIFKRNVRNVSLISK